MIVTVVGMKFRGNHRFSTNDIIFLEKDENNPYDKNAIKVMVDEDHKGFLTKEDAIKVRKIENFESKVLEFVQHFKASAQLQIK
jgi:hypothetical protein